MNKKSKVGAGTFVVLEHDDLVLGSIPLPSPCPVRVRINERRLVLSVGPRDLAFDIRTGKLVGSGCMVG